MSAELLNFVNSTGVEVANIVTTDSGFWTTRDLFVGRVDPQLFIKTAWKQPKCAGPKPGYGGTNTDSNRILPYATA